MLDFILTPIPGTDLPILFVLGLVSLWFYLRGQNSVDSSSAFDARLGRGTPVVLQFFSNT